MSRSFALVAALVAATGQFTVALAAPIPKGAKSKSWVGKTVFPRKSSPVGTYKQQPAGLPRLTKPDGSPRELTRTMYAGSWEVQSESGTRVEVIEGGAAFWMQKEQLVLLGEAEAFYTKALAGESRDPYLYNSRGWARHLSGKNAESIKDFDEFMKPLPNENASATQQRKRAGLNNRGLALVELGKFDAAIKDFDESLRLGYTPAHLNRGWTYHRKGDYRRAVDDYTAILATRPDHVSAQNNLAWLKATCPDPAFRDGKEAVKIAKSVCERTGNRTGMYLDTLAAAYAEAGDFAAAVAAESLALEDARFLRRGGDEAQARLRLYESKKPYRNSPQK